MEKEFLHDDASSTKCPEMSATCLALCKFPEVVRGQKKFDRGNLQNHFETGI
jgi:hypothetical protein